MLVQDDFPNTVANRWAYEGIALAEREKVIAEPGDTSVYRRRPYSRYELAVVLRWTATNQINRLEAFLKNPKDDAERASLLRSAALMTVYRQAEREFKRELNSLGVDGDFGQARIAALTKQIDATSEPRHRLFRDVPPDHWAAKAVGDLRALGLLDGYPDGRLRG